MPAALPLKHPVKVGQLVRRRLRELKRTPRELADAVQVSEDYIVDIVAGRRRRPARVAPTSTCGCGCSSSSTPHPRRSRSRTARTSCAIGSCSGTSTWRRGRCGSCCARAPLPVRAATQTAPSCGMAPFVLAEQPSSLELDDVLRRRTLLALDDVELNALALGQRLESVQIG